MRIISDSMSTLQQIQNLHPSQKAAMCDEDDILDALISHTERECHLTVTWCPSHSGVGSNELADEVAEEGTTVEQEGVSHHYDSAKTTKQPPITHKRLCHIYDKRGENVKHK